MGLGCERLAWALGGIALAITIAVAALSFRFVESPFRRVGFRLTTRSWAIGWRRSRQAAIASATALVLVVAGAAGTAVALVMQPETSTVEQRIQAGEDAIESTPSPTADSGSDTATDAPDDPAGPPAQLQGDQITAIGDSVMLAAVPELQAAFPGIQIDAAVSRQMSSAPAILQGLIDAGALRPVVVLALGTNGSISREALEQVRQVIGAERELVVVTAQAPRGWIPTVNERLASFAWQYRNVELADWYTAVQPHLAELAHDQVHFGHVGAGIFTGTIQEALQRLASLPPLRDDAADESLPRPV